MTTRIATGLIIALLVGAVMAIPASAKPGKGAEVVKNVAAHVDDCQGIVGDELGISEPTASRWTTRSIKKLNGRWSKFKCHFKGLDVQSLNGDLPMKTTGFACQTPAGDQASRSRLKVNGRGNGWLMCAYRPNP